MKLITNPYIRFIKLNDSNNYLAIVKPGTFITLTNREYFILQKKIFTSENISNFFTDARLEYLMVNRLIMNYDSEFEKAQQNILARQYG